MPSSQITSAVHLNSQQAAQAGRPASKNTNRAAQLQHAPAQVPRQRHTIESTLRQKSRSMNKQLSKSGLHTTASNSANTSLNLQGTS